MSVALFSVTIDTVLETVTFADNGSDITPTSIDIYLNGEDKLTTNALFTKNITGAQIATFMGAGVTYTYLELFATAVPLDNFYLTQVIFNASTTPVISNKIGISFTYQVAELVHRTILGTTIPIEDLDESLRIGSMPQILEYLQTLSTNAVYTYDREVKWRKAYNYLNTIVNDLDY